MIEEKLCDERHAGIEESLRQINSKLDIVIRHDENNKDAWKFISIFLVVIGLVIGAFKLLIN